MRVVEDAADWCALWDRIHANRVPPPPCDPAAIDFSREVGLVAAIGIRPDGCHDVLVSATCGGSERDPRLTALVREIRPAPPCICPAALTSPVEVVRVARPAAGVVFFRAVEVLDCR